MHVEGVILQYMLLMGILSIRWAAREGESTFHGQRYLVG